MQSNTNQPKNESEEKIKSPEIKDFKQIPKPPLPPNNRPALPPNFKMHNNPSGAKPNFTRRNSPGR